MKTRNEVEEQRIYYANTALEYEEMHLLEMDEHFLALSLLVGVIDYLGVKSVLDIGSGTGRAIRYLKKYRPDLYIVGVEPVKELREVGYRSGLSEDELREGDALDLDFNTGEFDLVCEFAVLHHVKHPEKVVSEMLRVAKKAVFISDANNFGQGSLAARTLKQILHAVGLWGLADWIKTRGKGYTFSNDDGIAYSYSVFKNYHQISLSCERIHLMNTGKGGRSLYRSAPHLALLGIKNSNS